MAAAAAKAASPPGSAAPTPRCDTGASAPASARGARPTPRARAKGPTMQCLMRFLFPETLEQPQSTGRLELFARYGPVDDDGHLRGGIRGGHVISDMEIRLMVQNNTREALFAQFTKPRSTVEVIVDILMPHAMAHQYTASEVRRMLRDVPVDEDGRLDFAFAQRVILESQRARLRALLGDGGLRDGRTPRANFQSKPAHLLTAVSRKEKQNEQEENLHKQKRLHGYCTLVAGMEDQADGRALFNNVILCRDRGDVSDRWDRYCSVRRCGKASYVQARNEARQPPVDDGLGDRHAGVSSLLAASMHGLMRR
eukprot:TRINITY_DN30821_c0_g1_i1.p1 TRINITY_DN30821_c0_g1~~TRINITY_DN30821_c0_g1_i1.p1  ORF type:complete len:311 (-),score=79.77 TRINITY_DN30821_c0_g1_i1:69-1001(-)